MAALAVIGGIALLMFLLLVLSFLSFAFDGPDDEAKVSVDTEGETETIFQLVAQEELRGTNLLRIDIGASHDGSHSGPYSGGDTDTRNILLIDKTTGESRKLLPDSRRHIRRSHFLPGQSDIEVGEETSQSTSVAEAARKRPVAYFIIELQQLEGDLIDIVAGTLAGDRRAVVMSGLDGVDSVWMHSPSRIGFIVRQNRGLHYRILDMPTMKIVFSRKIEIG